MKLSCLFVVFALILSLNSLQIIWNSSTRAELLKFVDQQRLAQGPDGSYDIKDSHDFVYKALSKELFIGNVYLRVYNDQPDFEISEPETFCLALIDFISYLVHNLCEVASHKVEDANHNVENANHNVEDANDNVEDTSKASEDTSEAVGESVNEQRVVDNSGTMSEEHSVGKEELELIKSLHSALTSLQVNSLLLYFVVKCFLFDISEYFCLLCAEPSDE